MKGKKFGLKTIIIVILAVCLVVVGFIVYYKAIPKEAQMSQNAIGNRVPVSVGEYAQTVLEEERPYVENQVLAIADSKREAKKIAGEIGGELVSYDNQVAVIQIGITVEEMMQRLKEDSSLPKVYPNYQNYTN